MTIRWLPRAVQDLVRVSEQYLASAPQVERRMVMAIYDAVQSLEEFPDKGRVTSPSGARRLVVQSTPYLVTYRLSENVVEVVRVRHGTQKPFLP